MAKKIYQRPKGTYDILPQDQIYWDKIRKVIKDLTDAYRFQRIDTPVLEETDLFTRGTGLNTDIVEKQMYNLKTKGGDFLTLRPEATPSIIRAYLENGLSSLPQPLKLYYFGPMFRYEQPQAGRFRQFYQFGAEIIGEQDSVLDVQIIQFFFNFLKSLGLKKINLQINSIGCSSCRPNYRKILTNYYKHKTKKICADCRRRLKQNPLRVLDCKQEKCQSIIEETPGTLDYLCEECKNHFKNVLDFLDELETPYFLKTNLVRGLDYYTKTVFEIWPEEMGTQAKKQSALVGGGRYDGLIKLLGGKNTPAVGAAAGLERIIAFLKESRIKMKELSPPQVFLVQLGALGKKKGLKLFYQLQNENISLAESFSRDSIKSQLKIADRLGAKIALILGQQEALEGTIIMRDMVTGAQETLLLEKIIPLLKKKIKNS